MLTKLLKQDIRATWRDFALLFLAIILAALLFPTMANTTNDFLVLLTMFLLFGVLVATMAISIMCLFRLFNRNIYSNEGYLTMTLPVTANKLVLSKFLIGTGWISLTGIVGALSFLLSMVVHVLPDVNVTWNDFLYIIDEILHDQQTGGVILCMFLILFVCILSVAHGTIQLYFCCGIAHLKKLKGFRIPVAVIAFFVIYWLESEIMNFVNYVVSRLGLFDGLNQTMMHLISNNHEFTVINISLLITIVIMLIPIVLLYLGTLWMVKNKMELE